MAAATSMIVEPAENPECPICLCDFSDDNKSVETQTTTCCKRRLHCVCRATFVETNLKDRRSELLRGDSMSMPCAACGRSTPILETDKAAYKRKNNLGQRPLIYRRRTEAELAALLHWVFPDPSRVPLPHYIPEALDVSAATRQLERLRFRERSETRGEDGARDVLRARVFGMLERAVYDYE